MRAFPLRSGVVLLAMALSLPLARGAEADTTDQTLLALLNEARAAAGQNPLVMVPALQAMASEWSTQLMATQRLSHRPVEQQTTWVEQHFTAHWREVAENVGFGHSALSLHQTFMQSEKHRHNALGDFTHVGVGTTRDAAGRIWVTINFVAVPDALNTPLPNPSGPARSAIATAAPSGRPLP